MLIYILENYIVLEFIQFYLNFEIIIMQLYK